MYTRTQRDGWLRRGNGGGFLKGEWRELPKNSVEVTKYVHLNHMLAKEKLTVGPQCIRNHVSPDDTFLCSCHTSAQVHK